MLYESWTAQNPEAAAALTIDGEDEWMNTMDIQLGTGPSKHLPPQHPQSLGSASLSLHLRGIYRLGVRVRVISDA